MGGSVGLAQSAGTHLATQRPVSFIVFGLWGTALLLVAAAAIGVLLATGGLTGIAHRLLVALGMVTAAVLLIRGVLIEILLAVGAYDGNKALTAAQRHWTLVLWNPWFLAGGIAFGLAAASGWRGRSTRDRSRMADTGSAG